MAKAASGIRLTEWVSKRVVRSECGWGLHLNVWTRSWEAWQRSIKAVQDWVDRWEDGPTISTGDEQLSHGGHDADGGLGPDLGQDGVDGTDAEVVEDLSGLHSLTGGNVQAGHIPADIGIANKWEKMGSHLDNVCLINQDKCTCKQKVMTDNKRQSNDDTRIKF